MKTHLKIKKRNPIVLEMIKMKGYGIHKKSNKAIRNKQKIELKNKYKDEINNLLKIKEIMEKNK